jgi:hypothetical protein
MRNYTFYLIESDGYLVGSTFISCSNDTEALAKTAEMLRTFDARVEVWDGSRKVGHLEPGMAIHVASIEQVPTPKAA